MNKKENSMETKPCGCGCGQIIATHDKRNRPRKYVFGHHVGAPRTEKQMKASIAALASRRLSAPWNKGKTYVMKIREVYADKRALAQAMKRLFSDKCMRCGWSEGTCDAHHIQQRSKGGDHKISNAVILCPNCHRLVHNGKISNPELMRIRSAAIQLNQSH